MFTIIKHEGQTKKCMVTIINENTDDVEISQNQYTIQSLEKYTNCRIFHTILFYIPEYIRTFVYMLSFLSSLFQVLLNSV